MSDLTKFKEYLETEAELAEKTIVLYLGCVDKALRCEDLRDPLFDEKLGKSRRETYQRALKHYAAFTDDEALLEELKAWRPSRKERRAKRKKGTPRALGLDTEWVALRAAIDQLEDPILRGVLGLLATSGLRIAEVLALSGERLRTALRVGSARISSKGEVERYFIVTEGQRAYVRELADALEDDQSVVERLYSKRRASYKGVEAAIKRELVRAGEAAGIDRPEELHPHMLRRTVGDAIYRATGGDLRAVQEALGHKDWKTTVAHYQDHAHLEETTSAFNDALKGRPQ